MDTQISIILLTAALGGLERLRHLRLALIDAQDLSSVRQWSLPSDQYANRVSSLTPTSVSYLKNIGVWPHVDTTRVQAYHHMRIWDGLAASGRISFDNPANGPAVAFMTENQNLTRALSSRIQELSDVDVFDKTRLAGVRLGPDPAESNGNFAQSLDLSNYPHLQLSSGPRLAARLLVGADGPNSPVRAFGGIPTRGWDYGRHGVVATMQIARDHRAEIGNTGEGATAYQRFLPTGPVALLPLPDGLTTLVWTTTPERASQLKSLSPEDFVAAVNAAFRLSITDIDYMSTISSGQKGELDWRTSVNKARISAFQEKNSIPPLLEGVQQGSVASFPLRLRHASTYVRPRIVLIGDAAHTIHPLAGQGLNMGLGDSSSLAAAVVNAVEHGADIGDETQCLNRYNSSTWMTNSRMLGVVDKLHWLYSTTSAPVVAVRGLGLALVDRIGDLGLKNWFMRQAGGV